MKTALKFVINAVHICPYFNYFFNLHFYFLNFLFLFPPPPILREPEDTEHKIKRIWPKGVSRFVKNPFTCGVFCQHNIQDRESQTIAALISYYGQCQTIV